MFKPILTQFALAILVLTASAGAQATQTLKATVNGMVCAFCAQGIEKRLSKLPATQAVFVDLKRRVVAVEAKPGQVLDGKLITAEITEAGYDVTRIESSNKTLAEIKAETKALK